MKYLDEYRDGGLARALAAEIERHAARPAVLMEICGGQTHTILRYGLDQLLPRHIELVHGPGCPVCVTPLEIIDKAVAVASQPGVILVTYGDMLRVPGSGCDLARAKAAGGDVRIVYSPLESLAIAQAHPGRRVVFLAVGFETTAPAHARAVLEARRLGLRNYFLLAAQVRVPPAIRLLLAQPGNRVQGFIAPGHVCAVAGCREYEELARQYHVPIVVGGFEPLDLLEAVLLLVRQLEKGRAEVENQYARAVRHGGNAVARQSVEEVFEVCDRSWRGLGQIRESGWRLRPEFAAFDAERVFGLEDGGAQESLECLAAEVLQGRKKPPDCPAFGLRCTPLQPLGAPMVSSEGACAAYYRYRRAGDAGPGGIHA